MKLYFASQNSHKKTEIAQKISGANLPIEVFGLQDLGYFQDLEENQNTFEGNALQKAAYVWHHYQVDCFADDSGLEVESLNNAPGVFSARYAGEHKNDAENINLLLKNLHGKTNRKACFRTSVVLLLRGETYYFEGVVQGQIIEKPTGDKGFGYDPIFVPLGYDKTFAQMSLAEKNLLSHRSQAIDKMLTFLKTEIYQHQH